MPKEYRIKNNFNISVPEDPEIIIELAKKSHPDFTKWMEERTGIVPEKLNKFWNLELQDKIKNYKK